ncbi:MAG: Ig-like domain-containing protein, partial [Oscillospiraceae bacterium]|nr:Ig-like domain-containing protein [Oscillospiraceae bacterium]
AMDPQNLLGVELSAGEHSLIIIPATNNAFVHKLDFTPAYEPAKISEISASVESSEIFVGVEQNISFSATPSVSMWYDNELGKKKFDGSAGTLGSITYSGYDANVISVSDDGKITALAPGNTTITVAAVVNGETLTDTIDMAVKLPVVSDVKVEAPRYILVADADGEALAVTAKKTDGTDVDMSKATVTYESLTPKFADVSADGIVTPKKEGTAEIKVTVTYEGVSAFATVEIPITKESLPDGSRFVIDFGTCDTSTTYTEDGVRFYAKAETRGANWSLDVANTTSNKYYDNGVQGIRVAQPGLTSFNRTGDYSGNQGFAIKFDVPETGVYDVSAEISIGPTCGYVDAYLIEGSTKTYIGSYDSWDASNSYPLSSVKLLSVSLEAGKDYSLMFYHSSSGAVDDRVYLKKIFFEPVKEASEVVGVIASVDDNNLAAGESVELIASAETSNGVIYEIEKSKRNADGGLSITYRSSDDSIASISDTGVIKAKTPGKVNITAEIELPNGTVSKDVQITVNENTYASAGVNIEEDSVYIVGGSQKLVPSAILSDGSSTALRDITARYESDNESVAKIEDGKLVAVAEGKVNITAYVTFNGIEKSVTKEVSVENVKLAAIEASANRVSALDMTGSQIKVGGVLNNGEKINLADAAFTFESLTPDIVLADENGIAYYVARGIGIVKVSAEIDGKSFECECEITSSSQKSEPTIYTYEMREQALVNAGKYDWARTLVKNAKAEADVFVENLDKIYDMIPVEGVPRASGMATWNASSDYEYVCPYCKVNLQEKYGTKPWLINPLRNAWKVQCPDCKRLFPSNDFESFYKLGITEDGVFDRELALQKNAEIVANGGEGYLVNKLYPNIATELGVDADKVSTWMVDDGFGWSDVDGTYGTNTLPKFCPAAHYAHLFWDSNGTDGSFFTRGIRALRDAYLYTSDAKYGRAGVILLDRVADVYPDFHLAKVSLNYPNSHGLGYNGKVVGQIWETNVLDVF